MNSFADFCCARRSAALTKLCGAWVIAILPVSAFAGDGGIKKLNYSVGVEGVKADYGDTVDLGTEIRVPYGNYTGFTLALRGSKFNGDKSFLDSESVSVGGGVILRRYGLGHVGASYEWEKSTVDLPVGITDISDENDVDNYFLHGTYYWNSFDLTLSRTIAKLDDGSAAHSWTLEGAYYPGDDISVSLGGAGMDAADNYHLITSYQPRLLDNALGLSVGYQNSPDDDDIFSISLNYYFDIRVNLKDRNRAY